MGRFADGKLVNGAGCLRFREQEVSPCKLASKAGHGIALLSFPDTFCCILHVHILEH